MYAESLASPRAEAETRTRLSALAAADKVDALVKAATPKLVEERTAHLGKLASAGSAEYLISFSGPAKIDEVKFVSGADGLKNAGPKLQAAAFHESFPDASSTKLFRRATVSCTATGCDALLMTADAVSSVD